MSEFWAHVDALETRTILTLSADEARHVSARRLREGDELTVFDGCGHVASARLARVTKKDVQVEVEAIEAIDPPTTGPVFATAVPKGDRLSTMLQMLSQLGARVWQPLLLDESVVRKFDAESPRVHRILVESAKLARRPWLLDVQPLRSLSEVLERDHGPGEACYGDRLGGSGGFAASTSLVLIGPEAGFTEFEREQLSRQRVRPVSLAPHNLRIETAAIAAAAAYHATSNVMAKGSGDEE